MKGIYRKNRKEKNVIAKVAYSVSKMLKDTKHRLKEKWAKDTTVKPFQVTGQ